jgi:hypothetical protein
MVSGGKPANADIVVLLVVDTAMIIVHERAAEPAH